MLSWTLYQHGLLCVFSSSILKQFSKRLQVQRAPGQRPGSESLQAQDAPKRRKWEQKLPSASQSKSKSEQRLAVKAGSKVQSISCASHHVQRHLGTATSSGHVGCPPLWFPALRPSAGRSTASGGQLQNRESDPTATGRAQSPCR